ncbi:hypothetical protein BVC80_8905g14 [Macleaya cordata]|uniref:Transmembrane protein n=1 Tax=Macleaya cordata TaxID=56857 RepID=A0A200RDU6_MACCD|nr:hypothetical protein BVC80_8905g14 [Macleaya cordata]
MKDQTCYMKEGKEEMLRSPLLSQRSSIDLLQNCDLPPPLKVFAGADKTAITSIRPPSYTKVCGEDEFPITRDSFEIEKLELLRALQLSQTRAREAERKAKLMTQERDHLSHSFLKESLRIFAYKQWVKLLEFEVSQLQSENQKEQKQSCSCGCHPKREKQSSSSSEEEKVGNGGDVGSLTWCMALALCLGIAGVGFVFGCTYYNLF